jgi:hypothetical protein
MLGPDRVTVGSEGDALPEAAPIDARGLAVTTGAQA